MVGTTGLVETAGVVGAAGMVGNYMVPTRAVSRENLCSRGMLGSQVKAGVFHTSRAAFPDCSAWDLSLGFNCLLLPFRIT